MDKEQVEIFGIGPRNERFTSKHAYTKEQAEEIRELVVTVYQAAWEEANVPNGKVSASPIVTG